MNPHDELGKQPEYDKDQLAEFDKRDILIHKVFMDTDEGRALADIFAMELVNRASDISGTDLYSLGKEEGIKSFMRNIITTIRKVEQ